MGFSRWETEENTKVSSASFFNTAIPADGKTNRSVWLTDDDGQLESATKKM